MKYITSLLLLFIAFCCAAQEQDYLITVNTTGDVKYKYVYFYKWAPFTMEKQLLTENGAVFKGKYQPVRPDGSYHPALLLVSNDEIGQDELLNHREYERRDFLLEPNVSIVYNSNKRHYSIEGDSLNKVHNIYRDNEWKFELKKDSLYAMLGAKYPDPEAREKEKKRIKRTTFLQEKESTLQLIKQNISAPVSLQNFVIYAMVPMRPVKEIRDVFSMFPSEVRKGKKGRWVDSLITVQENMFKGGLAVGAQMPVFDLKNTNGVSAKSISLFGKYTLVDFWASWCAPCRVETPNLISAYRKFHAKGFNIIAISIDQEKDRAKWLEAIEKDKSGIWHNLFNPGGNDGIAKELGINAIPANYLIDGTGKIIAKNLRGNKLEKQLEELFL
jgi:thiol-disulfide isomerase/thioredoxin